MEKKGKEKEEEEEREDDTKTGIVEKLLFLKKKMLRYRDNIVMVTLYRPRKVTLPNGKMEI